MPKHQDDFLQWFGSRIRSLRKHKRMTQADLARLVGIDRTYIGGVERGERNIGLMNIKKLADALNVSTKELFDDNYKF